MTDKPFADDKDWTWVLNSLCPECEFEVRDFPRRQIATLIRSSVADWLSVLATDEALVRQRPGPDRWSALEYASHVRDVFELYDHRLSLMLAEDGPHYSNWNQDETAIEKGYADADPAQVAVELASAGERLAGHFERVTDDDWQRTGYRSDGAAFTVETFARYFIHDPQHHLHDVRSGFAKMSSDFGAC